MRGSTVPGLLEVEVRCDRCMNAAGAVLLQCTPNLNTPGGWDIYTSYPTRRPEHGPDNNRRTNLIGELVTGRYAPLECPACGRHEQIRTREIRERATACFGRGERTLYV